MKKIIKQIPSHLFVFLLGVLLSASGVIAATILSGDEVSYTGNKVSGASNIQQAIDSLYTQATSQNSGGDMCSSTKKCRRAQTSTLHTEYCYNSSNYCALDGYSNGDIITYGNSTTTPNVLNTGDAFDCDVNGDGTYDPVNERFYYVYTKTNGITVDENIAVLIYSHNVTGGQPSSNNSTYAVKDDTHLSSESSEKGPVTAVKQIPTTTQWPNVSLSETGRQITYKDNTIRVNFFSYVGYAARFITFQEVDAGCYDGTTSVETAGGLGSKCQFLMENTTYSNSSHTVRGIWLESPHKNDVHTIYSVASYNGKLTYTVVQNTYTNSVRPAIEVAKSDIEY